MSVVRTSLFVAIAVAACGKSDEPPAPRERPPLRIPDARPPEFVPNRGAEILARAGIAAGAPGGTDWPGRWVGTQRFVGGPMTGTLPVDMEITRRGDGLLRLKQEGFGVVMIQNLVPSPDNPDVAAGAFYDQRTVNTVTFSHLTELTAIRTGERLAIGMHVETIDPGNYNGTPIPKSPPQDSIITLERKTRFLPPAPAPGP